MYSTRRSYRQRKQTDRFNPSAVYKLPQTKRDLLKQLHQAGAGRKCASSRVTAEPEPDEYLPYDEQEQAYFLMACANAGNDSTLCLDAGICPPPCREGYFFLEEILKRKQVADGSWRFLIRWLGYGPEDDSWEPFSNLNEYGKQTVIQRYTRKSKEPLVVTPEQKRRVDKAMEATRKLAEKINKYRSKRAIPLNYCAAIEGEYDDTDRNPTDDVEYFPPNEDEDDYDDESLFNKNFSDWIDKVHGAGLLDGIDDDIRSEGFQNTSSEMLTSPICAGKKLPKALHDEQLLLAPPAIASPPPSQRKLVRPNGSLTQFQRRTSVTVSGASGTKKRPPSDIKANRLCSNALKPTVAKKKPKHSSKADSQGICKATSLESLGSLSPEEQVKVWFNLTTSLAQQLKKSRKNVSKAKQDELIEVMQMVRKLNPLAKGTPEEPDVPLRDDESNDGQESCVSEDSSNLQSLDCTTESTNVQHVDNDKQIQKLSTDVHALAPDKIPLSACFTTNGIDSDIDTDMDDDGDDGPDGVDSGYYTQDESNSFGLQNNRVRFVSNDEISYDDDRDDVCF